MRNSSTKIRFAKRGVLPPKANLYGLVVNWGSTEGGNYNWNLPNVLNKPQSVSNAVDKIKALTILKAGNINVPNFWTRRQDVIQTESGIIFARLETRASSGRGIQVVRGRADLPRAPLYVEYIRKTEEYRLHIFNERCIFIQQKKAKADVARTDDQSLIRSHGNGFVFAENEVTFASDAVKQKTIEQAVAAVRALGLNFGAVDVIVSKKGSISYVLEVNTAPGVESTALCQAYKTAIESLLV